MSPVIGTGKYEQLLERCRHLEPVSTVVAHPCEVTALSGAIEAAEKGLIRPILVGPVSKQSIWGLRVWSMRRTVMRPLPRRSRWFVRVRRSC